MSGLARLLAGHTSPGVYHWSSATDPDAVAHAAQRAGWRFVALDTWQVDDKEGFLDACRRAFDLPDWFGQNFDALDDALTDVRAADGAGVLVLWDGWAPLARSHRRVFDVALSVFSDRVDFERGGAFAVLLHGPGPTDTDAPELDPHA
jgi:RNAse (barnase) inhibitor barstar